jgi:hypothetical protein
LVSYQEGSVVNRTLINDAAGTVTLFAFDEGDGLSEHTSPYEAFLRILEGEAEVTIGSDSKHLRQGQVIILPAGKRAQSNEEVQDAAHDDKDHPRSVSLSPAPVSSCGDSLRILERFRKSTK